MPLAVAPVGRALRITRMMLSGTVKKHMENLGFLVGGLVTLVASEDGDLIVKIKDSRIAINKGLAMKIFVE